MAENTDIKLIRRLFGYVKKHKTILFFTLIGLLLNGLLVAVEPYVVRVAVDDYIAQLNYRGLLFISGIFLLVLILIFLTSTFYEYSVGYLGQKLLFDIRRDTYQKLFRLNRDFFDSKPVGLILTYITNDVEAIREFIADGIVNVVSNAVKIIIIVAVMLLLNFPVGLITATAIPFFILITLLFQNALRNGYRGVRKANGEINSILNESINGIQEIKMFQAQNYMIGEMRNANGRYLRSFLKVVYSYSLYFPLIELMSNAVLAALMVFMHYYVGVRISVGDVYAYFLYANMVIFPLRDMMDRFNTFQSAMAASERVVTFLSDDREETPYHPSLGEVLSSGDSPLDGGIRHFDGDIEFKNITFSYGGRETVLDNVSFGVKKGEKIGLVGRTGSGKSTLVKLLSRLYELDGGDILIGGKSIRTTPIQELRRHITNFSQKTFLVRDSINNNIKFLDENISDERVIQVCRDLNMEDFITSFPKAYQQMITEEGKNLSLGQKQLLSFARAMIEERPIVILDEATASIDSHTEALIEKAMEKLLSGKTAIIIAHRLSTIRYVDRIVVMDKGKIVEEGSHDELMSRGGLYKKLYEVQSIEQS